MRRNSWSKQSSGCSKTQKLPTTSDIIGRLKAANGGGNYKEAERELQLREEHLRNVVADLRGKADTLEDDVVSLKAELVYLHNEQRVMMRELEVKDDQLSEYARVLSVIRDSEARAIKRYDKLDLGLKERCDEEKEGLMEKMRELGDQLRGKGVELSEVMRRIEGLEGEKAELERVVRVKDERIEELVKRNEQLEKGMKERFIDLKGQLDVLMKKQDGRIMELVKEKQGLVREKKEIMAKIDDLERDVVSCLCLDVMKDKYFSSSGIGKIIAGIVDALDSEDKGGMKITGNILEAGRSDSAFLSCDNEPNCLLDSALKSKDAARSKLFSEEEPSGVNMTAGNKNNASPICIQIDSDDEMPPQNSDLKRHPDEDSSVESLNPKRKIRKLEQLGDEPVKHRQPIVASCSRADHRFSTLQKQATTTIRKCEENLSRKVKEPRPNCPSEYVVSKSHKAELSLSPKLKEYMAKCMQNQEKNAIECVTDMVLACEKNDRFCAKAICALYRQHHSGCRRLEDHDINRVTNLAEFLIGGDPNSDKKKSMSDLKQLNPEGLDDCRKLARRYSEQLFEIFKSKDGDPLFSHLSTKVQDR